MGAGACRADGLAACRPCGVDAARRQGARSPGDDAAVTDEHTAAPGLSDTEDSLAAQAWLLVVGRPVEAQRLAREALAPEGGVVDAREASLAHRVLGMAALELDDADTSVGHLRRAIAAAHVASDDLLAAEAEMSLALALQHRGKAAQALRHAEAAHALAPRSARLGLQRALVLERLGRGDAALEAYAEVEQLARSDGHTMARVYCNRGVLLTYRGDFAAAARDLMAAETLCGELGLDAMAAGVRSNLGFLAARRGDLVEALRLMEADREVMRSFGGLRFGVHELDRCEVLLLAGLPGDAAEAGRTAIRTLDAAGMQAEAAEARVMTAQAALRDGDLEGAERLAVEARRAFSRQRRAPWAALAREVVVRAQWAAGRRDATLLGSARQVAGALDYAGWPTASASARLLSAQLALALGRTRLARTELEHASVHRTGPVGVRVQARHAQALLRLLDGDRRGAGAALRAGWRALEEHRATLGATDLRVGAGAHAVELSALGLRLAAESRRPDQVLAWAERGRAGALYQPPAQAPQGTPLAGALDALRTTVADLDAAAKSGESTAALLRRQAALEDAVRRQAQLAAAAAGHAPRPSLDRAALLGALGDAALVEFVVVDGALLAVVASDGRLSLHDLGAAAEAARESEALRMALGRLTRRGGPAPLRAAARAGAGHAASALASQLIEPLKHRIDARPLVLVPTGVLHGTPWAALPGLPMQCSVAPSAALWLRGALAGSARAAAGDAVLLAAGPGLEHADGEITALSALYPGAAAWPAARAGVDDVRGRLPHVTLAHLACHGRFRTDNPLFSALELTGGHLSVFELERLARVPERLVLSACDAGLSAIRPGDELMGLAATLLRLGARSLVASVLPVPDEPTQRLMVALHRALLAGSPVSTALGQARAALDLDADEDRVAAAAFLAFGAD